MTTTLAPTTTLPPVTTTLAPTTTLPPTTTTLPPTTPPPTTPPPTTTTLPPTTTTLPPTTPPPTTTPTPTTPPPTTTPTPTTPPPTTPSPTTTAAPTTTVPPSYVYIPPPLNRNDAPKSFSESSLSNGTAVGYSIALNKDVPFDFQFKDRFNNIIANDFDLANSYTNVSIGFDVTTTGDVMAPSGLNFRTGLRTTNYLFTQEQNSGAFGSPQRYYKLKYKLQEDAQINHLDFTVYHMPAEITGVFVSGFSQGQTGGITISVDTPQNGTFFKVRQFDLYTGATSGFNPSSRNLLKNFPIFSNKTSYDLRILKDEQPKGRNLFYKLLPSDDFGTGYFWTGALSGTLDYPREARTFLEAIPVRGSLQDRTGIFTGLASPALTEYDGISFYQTGVNQNLYVVKSGQWKTVQLT